MTDSSCIASYKWLVFLFSFCDLVMVDILSYDPIVKVAEIFSQMEFGENESRLMYDIFFGEADCPRVSTETEVYHFAILNCICLSNFDSSSDITRSF